MERLGCDRLVAIERPPERIDHPAEQAGSDRNPGRLAGRRDLRADPDRLGFVEDRRVDRVPLQRQRIAEPPALEAQKLAETRLGQAGHAGDAVGDLLHPADGQRLGRELDPRQRFALAMKPIGAVSHGGSTPRRRGKGRRESCCGPPRAASRARARRRDRDRPQPRNRAAGRAPWRRRRGTISFPMR